MIRTAGRERVCSQCANEAEPGSLLCETCEAVEPLERENAALKAEVERLTKALAELNEWAHTYGEDLCPGLAGDTYGNGVRVCKGEVARMIARLVKP